MRVANLSAGGDPFIASLVIKLWKERWYDEVDKFIVNYNNHSQVPQQVVEEFLSTCSREPKIDIIYHPRGCGNGTPIKEGTLISPDDSLILLLEDDGFIFSNGIVNECFSLIEENKTDIVGSPRRSCGQEIWDRSREKYNLDYSGYGDVGPNWWPNFFFCKRSDLLRTDLNFGSVTFTPGQYCKELDYTFKETNHGDTAVWANMQLRVLGLRDVSMPQHHASPFEIEDKIANEQNWHPTQQPFKWIHGGSLSSGWGGYLSGRLPDVSTDIAKQEIETRVAWWVMAEELTDEYESFKLEYIAGIEFLIDSCKLNRSRINEKIQIYKQLMNI